MKKKLMIKLILFVGLIMQGAFYNALAQDNKTATDNKTSADTRTGSEKSAVDKAAMNKANIDKAAQKKAADSRANADKSSSTANDANTQMSGNKSSSEKSTMDNKPMAESTVTMDQASMSGAGGMNAKMSMPDLSTWPMAAQMAAKEIMGKYGQPDGATPDLLIWKNKGPWKKIAISKEESIHNFPVAHTDMMTSCVMYKVPADKFDDLAKFDGSVVADRTQGTLSARCDKEMNNILALNLANDVITGKRTVEQARTDYGKIVMEKMKGGNPEYMQKLMFKTDMNAADGDVNTTGLDKEGKKVGTGKAEN